MIRWRRMNYPAKYYIRYIPFSYGLLLLLVANSSRVILEEREMWMDINKKLTAKLAIEGAKSDPKDLKPFSIDLVNSILRITELESHCSEDRPPWLLVLVFSRAESRRQRDEARRTWITQLFLAERPGTVKVVFVVGVKRGVDLVVRVRDEYRARRDMLVLFTDESPEDSIIKTLAAFQWVNEVCASSTHILKVNDDTFIDVGRFGVFVRTVVESNRYRNLPVIFGQCLTNVKVNRNPELMRFVPELIYPNSTFPTFCTGAAYLMNQGTLTLILSNMFALPNDYQIPYEDILITGILAQPGAVHVAHPGFANAQIRPDKFCQYRMLFTAVSDHYMDSYMC